MSFKIPETAFATRVQVVLTTLATYLVFLILVEFLEEARTRECRGIDTVPRPVLESSY